ncbi:MAG: alpha/beta fold hydrolase [Deltaproteobacteria bacterium]|nr:alpha/beta fold hydrolase [Deltaproteobacteria bacterium]
MSRFLLAPRPAAASGKARPRLGWVLVLLLAGLACQPATVPPPSSGASLHERTLTMADGRVRDYLLQFPPGLTPGRPAPLLVVLHGAFSDAREMAGVSGFHALADRLGLVVAYPNGLGFLGLFRMWNAGFCCGGPQRDQVDDVHFVLAVIADVRARLPVDPGRVYVVGYSNGGMLAHLVAASHPEKVAALAVVGGTVCAQPAQAPGAWQPPTPTLAVPVMLLHGRDDPRVPYLGGAPPDSGGSYTFCGALYGAELWAHRNQAQEPAREEGPVASGVERRVWAAGPPGAPVELWTLLGWGHAWPGPPAIPAGPAGPGLAGFNASQEIWHFCRRFRRDAGATLAGQ